MKLQKNGWNQITFRGRSQTHKTNMFVLVCRVCVFNIKYNYNCPHMYVYINMYVYIFTEREVESNMRGNYYRKEKGTK